MVNLWASWCVPCRQEFPILQKLSARYGKKVAFLGVNSEDSDDAAATFLEEAPVPYPSYNDPDKEIYDSLGGYGFPNTAFYNRSGEALPPAKASTATKPNWKPTCAATRCRADNPRQWKRSSSSQLIGVGLLLAELLLPTGGVLALLGVAGLTVAGVVAFNSDSDFADFAGGGLIALGVISGITFYFVSRKVLAAHRNESVRTGTEEMVGADRRGAQLDRPRGQGLARGHDLERAAGRWREPDRAWG